MVRGVLVAPRRRAEPPSVTLERRPELLSEPDFVAEAPLERFAAFLDERRAYGWVRLETARLTDLLNAHPSITLRNAEVEHLADGRTEPVDALQLSRHLLLAVQATGRVGDPALRRRTRLHPVAVQLGSYLLAGFLHAAPGVTALEELASRPPMVPLTDAWLEHWVSGRPNRQWVGTMIFNRHLADRIEPLADHGDELPRPSWHPIGASPT